jgi:phosphotransferase system IIA component
MSKGDLLVEFGADVIARKAKGLITVVLVANNDLSPGESI